MTHFNEQDLLKLMKLSKIDCSEAEKSRFLSSLSRVVGYIEQLSELNTEGVPPCNHILESMSSMMREDEIGQTLDRETFLANCPAHIGGMIRVPPIIKTTNS